MSPNRGLSPTRSVPAALKASLRTAPWECLSAQRRKKVFDCQSGPGDKGPQGPPCDFGMVGNRKSRNMSFLRQNDMASFLAGNVPAQFPKGFHDLARLQERDVGHEGQALQTYFDLPDGYRQRHSFSRPNLQALFDRLMNVFFGFSRRRPLTDASRYRRAFSDEHTVFILRNRDEKLHFSDSSSFRNIMANPMKIHKAEPGSRRKQNNGERASPARTMNSR